MRYCHFYRNTVRQKESYQRYEMPKKGAESYIAPNSCLYDGSPVNANPFKPKFT